MPTEIQAAPAPLTLNAGVKNQREAWLAKATRRIIKKWAKLGLTVPQDVQLSCGFPGGGSPRRRIGECWPRARSEKGVNQVFINPTLGDPFTALDVLGHELVHAADDCKSGHGHAFTKNSVLVGYSGGKHSKATSKAAVEYIARLIKALGPYPHGALVLGPKKLKENTGLHKFECANGGESPDVLYSTSKNVEIHGVPQCRCCQADMVPAGRNDKKIVKTI